LTVKEGRAQSAIATLKQLRTEADTLGFKRLSVACSVYLAEALLKTNDYKQARAELERALPKAERLGLQSLQPHIPDLLGSKLEQSGNKDDAASQYAEARRLLDEIAKEAHSTEIQKRIDLSSIIDHSSRTNSRN